MLLIGLRGGENSLLRQKLLLHIRASHMVEEACHGSRISSTLKAIIADEPQDILDFIKALEGDRIIGSSEAKKAINDLGIRAVPLHPLFPKLTTYYAGEGI